MKPIDIKKTMGNMNDTIFDVFFFFFFTEIAKYNLNPKNSMFCILNNFTQSKNERSKIQHYSSVVTADKIKMIFY